MSYRVTLTYHVRSWDIPAGSSYSIIVHAVSRLDAFSEVYYREPFKTYFARKNDEYENTLENYLDPDCLASDFLRKYYAIDEVDEFLSAEESNRIVHFIPLTWESVRKRFTAFELDVLTDYARKYVKYLSLVDILYLSAERPIELSPEQIKRVFKIETGNRLNAHHQPNITVRKIH